MGVGKDILLEPGEEEWDEELLEDELGERDNDCAVKKGLKIIFKII